MIEQHRTMEIPGAGIVRDRGPTMEHNEYPKHMRHPGYRKGKPDKEIRLVDENGRPTGGLAYSGGESIRFPPVLVFDVQQEEFHKSQGYETVGKSDPAAFARLVADAEPVEENYKPIEFPKWSHGKLVQSAEEEADHLAALGIDKMGRSLSSELKPGEPALETEANTLEVWAGPSDQKNTIALLAGELPSEEDEIAALEAKLAALKAKIGTPVTHDEAVARLKDVISEEIVQEITAELEQASTSSTAPPEMTRGEKIKAGIARKKAEREAAAKAKALRDEVQAEAEEAA